MWLSELLGASWSELVDRLDRRDTFTGWQRAQPELLAAGRLSDLPVLTAIGADPARSDAVLGALVRLAAVDGGDDRDAALVVLHLLRPGLSSLRSRLLAAGVSEAGSLVVGQAMIEVRAFPWSRRRRAHAANILRDTSKALAREFAPAWAGREVLVDPLSYEAACCAVEAIDSDAEEPELGELLAWVERTGAVDVEALQVLLDYTAHRALSGSAHARVAAAHGLSTRTCKRRCAAALAALRAAVPEYLAA